MDPDLSPASATASGPSSGDKMALQMDAQRPDGPLAGAATGATSPQRVKLSLRRPSALGPGDGRTREETFVVESGTTVGQVKDRISSTWTGRPKVDGMKLIARGRILTDAEAVAEALDAKSDPEIAHPVHVVIPSTGWTVPTPVEPPWPPPGHSPPASSPPPADLSAPFPPSLATRNVEPPARPILHPLLSHFLALDPAQRARFRLQLASADAQVIAFSVRIKEASGTPAERARLVQKWTGFEIAMGRLLRDIGFWGPASDETPSGIIDGEPFEFTRMGSDDLRPFLVYHRPSPSSRGLKPAPRSLAVRIQRMSEALAEVVALVHRFDAVALPGGPSLPVVATAAASQVHLRPGWSQIPAAVVEGRRFGPLVETAGAAAGPRVRQFELVVNLEAIVAYVGPLLWLSAKLSFLLYLFARNASRQKRSMLVALAVAWVVWEGLAIRRRRQGDRRRRHRSARNLAQRDRPPIVPVRERPRRAPGGVDAAAPVSGPVVSQGAQTPADGPVRPGADANTRARHRPRLDDGDERARGIISRLHSRGGLFPPGTETRRRPSVAFSTRYWISSLALVGLAREYRQLGRKTGRGGDRRLQRSDLVQRLGAAVVLFLGTLLPEVEKKRKRALDRRLRLLQSVSTRLEQEFQAAVDASEAGTAALPADGGPPADAASPPTPRLRSDPTSPMVDGGAAALFEDTDEEGGQGAEGGQDGAGLMLF